MKVILIFFSLISLLSSAGIAKVNLSESRTLCETLTNENIKEIQGNKILKRKDLLLFHVRRLCENIEYLSDENLLGSPQADADYFDLKFILGSWMHKFKSEAGVGYLGILNMGINHDISPFRLRFDRPKLVPTPQILQDSIFWRRPQIAREQVFDAMAKQKNINPNFKIAILDEMQNKGSTPKIHIKDYKTGARWLMKWGDEIHADPVSSRIFSALGYNVDFTYYVPAAAITLVLGKQGKKKRTVRDFVRFIFNAYGTNLSPFILAAGKINADFLKKFPEYAEFKSQYFVRFKGAAVEARPSSELRLGGMMTDWPEISKRRELRGALLAHLWLGSWDTKEDNTLLSIWKDNSGQTRLTGSYSDIGLSLGVHISKFPRDVKGGLINSLPWQLVEKNREQIRFNSHLNAFSKAYLDVTYEDLYWMAQQISEIDQSSLETILSQSGWPHYVQKLFFYKLAERRRQILDAFEIKDPHPIVILRNYHYEENGIKFIQNGELSVEPSTDLYPEGLLHEYGRFRGFGW